MKKIYTYSVLFILLVILTFSCTPDEPFIEIKTPDKDSIIWLSEVFKYVYAPGQHALLAKSEQTKHILGDPSKHSNWLYLGGFGGFVIAGFSEDIPNKEGYDFEIYGYGIAPEPAIVYVMPDLNGDELPNDTCWFELKGSEFEHTTRDYSLTYYKPSSAEENISWKDNQGNTGEILAGFKNHADAKHNTTFNWWWPETLTDSINFIGSKLPDAYIYSNDNGSSNWHVPKGRFSWGYAENIGAEDYDKQRYANKFDISNAVDKDGNSVYLENIRFIKIQTAVFQQAGQLNEISAEIRGAAKIN